MTPKQGDRIIIKDIPQDYHWKCNYEGPAVIDNIFSDNETAILSNGYVGFYTGYLPYKDKEFECSGAGHGVKLSNMKHVGIKPAKFWKFKGGIRMAHNAEYYTEPVNFWEVNFSDLN